MAIASLETILSSDGSQFVDTVKRAREETKAFNEALSDGKRVFDATRTPAEKYEAEVAKLNHLLAQGAISSETHSRAIKQAGEAFGHAAGGLDQFRSLLPPSISGLISMAAPLAAATVAIKAMSFGFDLAKGAVSAFVDLIASGFEEVDRIDKLSGRVGIAADSFLALQHAARLADVEAETLEKGIEKLQQNIGKAAIEGGTAAKAFERLGLDAGAMTKQGVDKSLAQIADKLAAISSPAERAAAAADLFGAKLGKEMVSLLGGGSQALADARAEAELFGQTLSEFDKSQVDEASKAWDRINAAVSGLGMQLAVEVAPAVEAMASIITEMVKSMGGVANYAHYFAENMKTALEVAGNIAHLAADPSALMPALAGGELAGTQLKRAIEEAAAANRAEFERQQNSSADSTAVDSEIAQTEELEQAIQKQIDSLHEQAAAVASTREEYELQRLAAMGASDEQINAVKAAQEELATAKAAADAAKEKERAQKDAAADAERLAKEFADIRDDLQFADSSSELDSLYERLKKLEKAGYPAQAIAGIEAMIADSQEMVDAQKAGEERDKAAKKIIEANMTAQERFNAALADAQRLREVGAIDEATFLRERARLEKELGQAGGGGDPFASPSGKDRAVAALQRGSAEAFSAINRAGGGKKDTTEKSAAATAANTAGLREAIVRLGDEIKAAAPIPVSIL